MTSQSAVEPLAVSVGPDWSPAIIPRFVAVMHVFEAMHVVPPSVPPPLLVPPPSSPDPPSSPGAPLPELLPELRG
jgi:hypothetical protein